MEYTEIVNVFRALGDTNRVQILELLKQKEICACKILEEFDITQPTLSHHLKVLCECKLINLRKDGKWCYYSLNKDKLTEISNYFNALKNE